MGTYFGGTWEVYGAGAVTVAKDATADFDTIGETGGAKTHTLTVAEIPSHTHVITSQGYGTGTAGDALIFGNSEAKVSDYMKVSNIGSGTAHNNLQPYIVVYRYRRTA